MKIDNSIYKNSWRIFKKDFMKLFTFTISLMVVLIASIVVYVFIGAFDGGIIGICLTAFVFVPLLFSFQRVIVKTSSGQETYYNDLYKSYKTYFQSQNRGTYRFITSFLIYFLLIIVFLLLGLTAYDLIFPNRLPTFNASDLGNIEATQECINNILSQDHILYFFVVSLLFPTLIIFRRTRKSFMLPYFSIVIDAPNMIAQRINKKLYEKYKDTIRSVTLTANILYDAAFSIFYLLGGCLTVAFASGITYIELYVVIALSCGLLGASILFVPQIITYCFCADQLQTKYLTLVKDHMMLVAKNIVMDSEKNGLDNNELKKSLEDLLNSFKTKIDEEQKDNIEQEDNQTKEQNDDEKKEN